MSGILVYQSGGEAPLHYFPEGATPPTIYPLHYFSSVKYPILGTHQHSILLLFHTLQNYI